LPRRVAPPETAGPLSPYSLKSATIGTRGQGEADDMTGTTVAETPPAAGRTLVYRLAVLTRVTQWINALCILVLFMSGLQICTPLYIGQASADAPVLAMTARAGADGVPTARKLGATFDTTGVLGV
jgi:hypothetical protein